MKSMIMHYPDDLAQAIQLTPDELIAQVKLMAALKMFELGKLSSAKAAEFAGLSRVDFIEACGRYHVSIFNYIMEEVEGELKPDIAAIEATLP